MTTPLRLVGSQQFRSLLTQNGDKLPENVGLLKDYVPVVKVLSETERIIRFTISTGTVDRMNDTVNPAGWDLVNFIRGGQPVLFGHDRYNPVVGRGVRTWMEGDKLASECQFTPRDLSEFGFMVFQLYANDYMRATSVGFMPLEFSYAEDRNRGVNYLRQELMEYSMVPVPANPECLAAAKSAGLDVQPMRRWAERSLDLLARPTQDGMMQERLERLRAVCDDTQIRYFVPAPVEADVTDETLAALKTAIDNIPQAVASAVKAALQKDDTAAPAAVAEPAAAPAAETPAEPAAAPAETPAAEPAAAPAETPAAAPVSAAAPDAHVLTLDEEVELGVTLTADDLSAIVREAARAAITEHTGRLD